MVQLQDPGPDRPPRASPSRDSRWVWLVAGLILGVGFGFIFSLSPDPVGGESPDAVTAPTTTVEGEISSTTLPGQEDVGPGEGISEEVPGFPDGLVALSATESRSLEHIIWPLTGSPIVRPLPAGDFGDAAFDVSGRWIAVTTRVPGTPGSLLSTGIVSRLGPLAFGVTSFAWHDSEEARLSYVEEADGLWRLWEVDADREPKLVTASSEGMGSIVGWGEWGWAVQNGDHVRLLNRDGVLRTVQNGRALDTHPSGWVVVVNGDDVRLVSAGGGVRGVDIDLERLGLIEVASLSPDGDRLAVIGGAGMRVVTIGEDRDGFLAPVTSPFPLIVWSSDSRFILFPWIRGVFIVDLEDPARDYVGLDTREIMTAAILPLSSEADD